MKLIPVAAALAVLLRAASTPTLVNTCLITDHIDPLIDFYEHVLGVPADRTGAQYAEFHTGGTVLAIFSSAAQESYIPGSAKGGHNASAILEFRVSDLDAEYRRLLPLVQPRGLLYASVHASESSPSERKTA